MIKSALVVLWRKQVEKMRREGFEFQVSPPEVLYKTNEKGQKLEPIETVFIEVDDVHVALVMEKVSSRCGKLIDCQTIPNTNRQKIHAEIPTRGLSGLRTEIQGETSGSGTIEKWFKEYQLFKGPLKRMTKGAIISTCDGKVTAYGMKDLEKFGRFFIKPGNEIYKGMVIGESSKGSQDVEVNPTKAKKFTNIRTHAVDEAIRLTPPKEFSIEELISYVRGTLCSIESVVAHILGFLCIL